MNGQLLKEDRLPGMVVVDVEASGLHVGSYPIEIGWCFGNLSSGSFLIRPHETWGERDWSWESEKVHGIPMRDCLRYGIEVEEAAQRVNETFRGHDFLVGAPAFDGMWIKRLFDTAGVRPEFTLMSLGEVYRGVAGDLPEDERENIENRIQKLFPYTHRAEEDARNMAAKLIAAAGCCEEIEKAFQNPPSRPTHPRA